MEYYHGFKCFFHSGSYIGYWSFLGFVPELNLAFASDHDYGFNRCCFALAYQIIDLFAGIKIMTELRFVLTSWKAEIRKRRNALSSC